MSAVIIIILDGIDAMNGGSETGTLAELRTLAQSAHKHWLASIEAENENTELGAWLDSVADWIQNSGCGGVANLISSVPEMDGDGSGLGS